MLADLLARPGVVETVELRGRVGFLALHGGHLEKVTDVIAREAAEASDSSYYGVWHPDGPKHHVPSTAYDPAQSTALHSILDHIDVAVAIHGYGRDDLFHTLLVGGRNRSFAGVVSDALRSVLPDPYEVRDDIDGIPKGLRGLHERNPVNLPRLHGVQIELPPTVRWNREDHNWSEFGDAGRARHIDALIERLAAAAIDFAG